MSVQMTKDLDRPPLPNSDIRSTFYTQSNVTNIRSERKALGSICLATSLQQNKLRSDAIITTLMDILNLFWRTEVDIH